MCKAAYQKIQDLRAELDAQWAAYKEQNALFRVQLQVGALLGWRTCFEPPGDIPARRCRAASNGGLACFSLAVHRRTRRSGRRST